jgi:hypothetical protein
MGPGPPPVTARRTAPPRQPGAGRHTFEWRGFGTVPWHPKSPGDVATSDCQAGQPSLKIYLACLDVGALTHAAREMTTGADGGLAGL